MQSVIETPEFEAGTNCLLTSSHGFIVCSQRLDGSDNKQKLLATTLLGMAAGIDSPNKGRRGKGGGNINPFDPLPSYLF